MRSCYHTVSRVLSFKLLTWYPLVPLDESNGLFISTFYPLHSSVWQAA